jgi:hypothetical protein
MQLGNYLWENPLEKTITIRLTTPFPHKFDRENRSENYPNGVGVMESE